MGIVLTILKIIGITLLVILLLILFILLLILLVPIRYSASGGREAGKYEVTARVTWLLHMISIQAGYKNTGPERGVTKDVRILGISLKRLRALRRRKASSGREDAPSPAAELPDVPLTEGSLAAGNGQAVVNADFTAELVDGPVFENEDLAGGDTVSPVTPGVPPDEAFSEEAGQMGAAEEGTVRAAFWTNLPHAAARVGSLLYPKLWQAFSLALNLAFRLMQRGIALMRTFWQLPLGLMRKVWGGFIGLGSRWINIRNWISFLGAASTLKALSLTARQVKRIGRHVLPRHLEGHLEFGCEDPSWTGAIYGAFSAMYPRAGNRFLFIPSFEECKLNGEVSLKGKIVLGYVLLEVLVTFMNRNTRMAIRGYKNLKEGNR